MSTTYYPRDEYECTSATYTERRTRARADVSDGHRIRGEAFESDVDLTIHRYLIIELADSGDRAWAYGYATLDDVRAALHGGWWYSMQPGYVLDLDTGREHEIERSFRLDEEGVPA